MKKSSLTTDPQYRELQGRVALGKGQFDLCEQIFDKLIDDNPYNTDYWNTMALAQFQQGDTTACIESCDYALAIDPVNADAHIHKANSLAIIGNYPEAIKFYKKLQALQPYSESPDMGIASILAAQNHPQEALAHLKTAEKLATSTSPNKLEILRQQCILNAQLGHRAEALACIRKMDELPDRNTAENNVLRGYLYLLENQPEVARVWFKRAVEASNNDLRIQTLIAYSTYECGYTQFAHDLLGKSWMVVLAKTCLKDGLSWHCATPTWGCVPSSWPTCIKLFCKAHSGPSLCSRAFSQRERHSKITKNTPKSTLSLALGLRAAERAKCVKAIHAPSLITLTITI